MRNDQTLDDANYGWQRDIAKRMHADNLERLPGRAQGNGHRPHAHGICTEDPGQQ